MNISIPTTIHTTIIGMDIAIPIGFPKQGKGVRNMAARHRLRQQHYPTNPASTFICICFHDDRSQALAEGAVLIRFWR